MLVRIAPLLMEECHFVKQLRSLHISLLVPRPLIKDLEGPDGPGVGVPGDPG